MDLNSSAGLGQNSAPGTQLAPQLSAKRQKLQESPLSDDEPVTSGDHEASVFPEPTIDSSFPISESPGDDSPLIARAKDPKTGCYTSSIYVDAFNLALDTVLKEEAYLFESGEQEIFAKYRSLDYEAQLLYVRLFLRKTHAWFRVNRLQYSADISNIDAACATLQDPEVGLADSDELITLDEVAALLSFDELKSTARETKCTGANKAELIAQLRKTTKAQGSLQCSDGQLKLNFDRKGNYINREQLEIRRILGKTGPCIRLSLGTSTLFSRVHLVFYRSTQWTEKSLTTIILARTLRRNFPPYIVSRTSAIFPSRDSLVAYETALHLQNEVDDLLSKPSSRTSLSAVLDIFENLYPIWRTMIRDTPLPQQEHVYFLRFTALWVQTRIVHKGAYVLGRLHQYHREREVLLCLLAQTAYHPSRRGAWYDRLALLEEKHLPPKDARSPSALRPFRESSLGTCSRGLQDPQTHLVYHYPLQARIQRLERVLKIPKQDRHDFSHVHLTPPLVTTVRGTRLSVPIAGVKTVWKHPVDGSNCGVEDFVLAHYALEGFAGLHDEGRILKTAFAALFYDILFLPLPNVFQTEFQTAPLDLFTDAFYPGRASEINHRLALISSGGGPGLLKSFWEAEGQRQPCVVGLDWTVGLEACVAVVEGLGPEAISGISRILCEDYRVRASGMPDLTLWRQSKNGWEARLIEVKSENDRLSETQRVWSSLLRGLGVSMEVCWVRESGTDATGNPPAKKGKSR